MPVFLRALRSGLNITVLFSALVLTPLLALSHFNGGMASVLGAFSERYFKHPTLLARESKSRHNAQSQLREQRALASRERAAKRRAAAAGNKVVGRAGKRVLHRGAGALAVGWIPVVGVTADLASLSADYADLCTLFSTVDHLSAMLYLPESNLYTDNYCDIPDQGIQLFKESAQGAEFPWQTDQPL